MPDYASPMEILKTRERKLDLGFFLSMFTTDLQVRITKASPHSDKKINAKMCIWLLLFMHDFMLDLIRYYDFFQ